MHLRLYQKYNRNNEATYRTPEKIFLPKIVTLMKIFKRRPRILFEPPDSYKDTLTDPIGITNISGSDNCNATSFGWGDTEHNNMKDIAFYLIAPWFKEVFKDKTKIIK